MSSRPEVDLAGSYGPGLLNSIWRYRYHVAVTTMVTVLLGYVISALLTPVYEATASIVLSDADAFGAETVDPERNTQQEANRLTSRAVYNNAADRLGADVSADVLRRQITVEADPGIGVITVTATNDDPETAARTANTVIEAYRRVSGQAVERQLESATEVLREQGAETRGQIDELRAQLAGGQNDAVTRQRIETLESQLVALESRMSEMEANAALYGSGVETVENAVPPSAPASPKPLRNALIAGVVGMAVASAFAYWRAGVVESAKFDPSAVLGAPLLAEIPEFARAGTGSAGENVLNFEASEAYQFLVASFEYAIAQTNARSILVTSASPGDGKSLTALHLARALSVQGREVMLVDADIRAHGLTTLLRSEDQPGLVALAHGSPLSSVVRRYRISDSEHLSVIPSGVAPNHPTGLLGTHSYREALAKITTNSELTIIDGGPLLTVADASAVAGQVSGILLVVDARMSQDDLHRVHERLQLIATPLLGYVLNRVPDRGDLVYPYGLAEQPAERRGLLRLVERGRSGLHRTRPSPTAETTGSA